MTKRYSLSDMVLDECSLVDKGANPGARVLLFKRDVEGTTPEGQRGGVLDINVDGKTVVDAVRKAISESIARLTSTWRREVVVSSELAARIAVSRKGLAKHGEHDQSSHGGNSGGSGRDSVERNLSVARAENLIHTAQSYQTRTFGSESEARDAKKTIADRLRSARDGYKKKIDAGDDAYTSAYSLLDSFMADNKIRKDKAVAVVANVRKAYENTVATMPTTIQSEAVLFDDLTAGREMSDQLCRMVYALQDSINSIMQDQSLSPDVRADMALRSINEFHAAAEAEFDTEEDEAELYKSLIFARAAITRSRLVLN